MYLNMVCMSIGAELFYREHSSNRSSPKTEGDKAQCIPVENAHKFNGFVWFGFLPPASFLDRWYAVCAAT